VGFFPTHTPPPLSRPAGRKRGAFDFALPRRQRGNRGRSPLFFCATVSRIEFRAPVADGLKRRLRLSCTSISSRLHSGRLLRVTTLEAAPTVGSGRGELTQSQPSPVSPLPDAKGQMRLPSFARRGERGAGGYEWGKNCAVGIEEERGSLCPSRRGMQTRLCGGTVK
jgi:hypothetical protein